MNAILRPAVRPISLDATTPSFGAHVTIEPAHPSAPVALHVNNDGGRGAPWKVLVIPVCCSDPRRMQPAIDLRAAYAQPPNGPFWTGHRRDVGTMHPGPYTTRFSVAEWHAIAPAHTIRLVILVFQQSPMTAEPGAPRFDRQRGGQTPEQIECARVLALFDPATRDVDVLRRGLVCLETCDLTDEAPTPAAPTCFVVASCQYPAGLLDDTPRQLGNARGGPADAAMRRLAARLDPACGARRPGLILLLGDQIYLDATAGLFDPRAQPLAGTRSDTDSLRVAYENWMATSKLALGMASSRTMLDDHEIQDNWEPYAPGVPGAEANLALRDLGLEGYGRYQRDRPHNMPLAHAWHHCSHRGLRFFLADTRTEREPRKALFDPREPRIMSEGQWQTLERWLQATPPGAPVFIASPSMLLPRRRSSAATLRGAIHSDAWDGYPGALERVLARLCQLELSNVVFLSGDEHLCSVTRAVVTDLKTNKDIVLHSIHSSGLYAPFPFANSMPAEFATPDRWEFPDPFETDHDQQRMYACSVEVQRWIPGDGYACVTTVPPSSGATAWELQVEFDCAGAQPAAWSTTLR